MKKIILSTLFLISVFSCKKESAKTEDGMAVQDSASVPELAEAPAALKMFNAEQTSEFLGKKNDTLYVTNFFATWCGPCVKEIPHFKNKIQELNGKPVKITFVSVDSKNDWNTKVPHFVDEQGIRNNTVLLDGQQLGGDFFAANFKEWDGSAIPFTFMRRGDKTDETLGMISEEQLTEKINSLLK
ncbi:TlpA family protein disulfide reductase [Chryseobacterium salviniae]|uniref:TlpA disulfide reductase family protein n=1 Tax=Chryseobacterium salviniae TaxID=3101750 RepID=A0ABU6HTD2_9FLAO|nr:TlpA disulfide reductase family protein [Chryseobacterium sp. T9W2-O]MEC3876309.1 TlpA disulfide reductase family protein [Chryseobacterium sp. T9W2-O]